MRAADAGDLKELAAWSEQWCVSAFVPAHESDGRQDGDLLRLKNMFRDAHRELVKLGMRSPAASDLLDAAIPAELTDRTSTEFHKGGIGIFSAPGLLRTYRVPVDMPELVTVGTRFHLKPIIGAIARERRFFVLTLTKGGADVYLGSLDGLEPIDIPGMPTSFDEVARFDEASDSRRWDELNRADHLPEEVLRYVRAVEEAVTGTVAGSPLIIGGTDALISAYTAMTGYRAVVSPALSGNPGSMSPTELHAVALERLDGYESRELGHDADRFGELNGTGRASGQLAAVLRAAQLGRIDRAFVAADRQAWGIRGKGKAALTLHDVRMPGDEDLLDLVAVEAWQRGAAVHVVPAADIPGTGLVAGIFRY